MEQKGLGEFLRSISATYIRLHVIRKQHGILIEQRIKGKGLKALY